jgi:hypothetical protein
VIARALKKQMREVHDFFAGDPRVGPAAVNPDRTRSRRRGCSSPAACWSPTSAWGLVGDDLKRARRARRWMLGSRGLT